jgi:hypothetical protein
MNKSQFKQISFARRSSPGPNPSSALPISPHADVQRFCRMIEKALEEASTVMLNLGNDLVALLLRD